MRSRLLVVWLTAAATALSVLAASPAEAASKPSRLTVVIKTPKGVPATVAVTGAAKRTVAKAPAGKRVTRTVKVKAGKYVVRPRQIVRGGRIYLPTKTVQKVRVKRGKTTKVMVTYRRAATAAKVEVRSLGAGSISVGWSAPKKAKVKVRLTKGAQPASSVRRGTAVRVKGRTATATKLKQGTTYSFSVFTKVKGTWVGPLSVTASPRASKSSGKPTFVTAPDTVMVPASAPVTLRPHGSRFTSTVPKGVQPVLGEAWVLPSTSRLPGGFLGRVASISADGRSVTLEPIGYPEAFAELSFSTKISAQQRLQVARISTLPSLSERRGMALPSFELPSARGECEAYLSAGTLEPTVLVRGTADYEFKRKRGALVPTSAKLESRLSVEVNWAFGLTAGIEAECQVDFKEFSRAFAVGPIPMGVKATLHAKLEVEATRTEEIRTTASAGIDVTATMSLRHPKPKTTTKVYSSVSGLDGTMASGLSGAIKLGGDVLLGPGTALPKVGGIAGLRTEIHPLVVSAQATTDPDAACRFSWRISSAMEAALEARVWFGRFDSDIELTIFSGDIDHRTEQYPEGCADVPAPEPTDPPTTTPGPTDPDDSTEEPTIDPGAHRLESVTAAGGPAQYGGREPSVSGDGRYLAFVSESPDLDPDRPRRTDYRVYVRDRVTGTLTPAPAPPSSEPLVRSYYPVISRDGRHVAYLQRTFVMGSFESAHVTVWDRIAGTTTVLPGDVGNSSSIPDISADGRHVLYATIDELGSGTLRLWDRSTGQTTAVTDGEEQPYFYALSSSGTSIATMTIRATTPEDFENADWSIKVRNRETGTTTAVADGTVDGEIAFPTAVSDSGDRVLINAIDPGDSGNATVRLWDGRAGTTTTAPPYEGYTDAMLPRASDDFSAIVFSAVTADSKGADVFEWSPAAGRVTRLSQTPSGDAGNSLSLEPAISADGRIIVYTTLATNLVRGTPGEVPHVLSWDRALATG